MSFKGDLFNPVTLEFCEAKGEVDGTSILGKVRGSFFVPNGVSRNNRFYPESLWKGVCEDKEICKKLKERRMFGTISHEQSLNDQALLEGKISHIVSDLTIEGDDGIGEALILDTPAGRILNTMLRAGAKLFVSSRANGTFKQGVTEKGVPVVDPDTYQLESFDFVMDPGFLQAQPKLVESLMELIESENLNKPANDEGEVEMSTELKELLESVTKEKSKLQLDLDKAIKEVETLKNENTVLTDENNHLKEESTKLEEENKELTKTVESFKELGTAEEISKMIDVAEKELETYRELGKADEIKEKVEGLEKLIAEYKELGETPDEIKEALEKADKVVEQYKEFGTPAELEEAFSFMEAEKAKQNEAETANKIKSLAKDLSVSEEKIKKLWDKGMDENEIREFYADEEGEGNDGDGGLVSERFRKKKKDLQESKEDKKENPFSKSRGKRLMESFN